VLSLPLPAEPPYAAIVGQHRDLAGTRALLGRLALRHGAPVPGLGAGSDRAFPAAAPPPADQMSKQICPYETTTAIRA
jgi:hypothetical protein